MKNNTLANADRKSPKNVISCAACVNVPNHEYHTRGVGVQIFRNGPTNHEIIPNLKTDQITKIIAYF